ncbi:alpha/beta hydrolase [Amycolatopsis acidiphila]|uniref:Alpha/beta hydrolase n=1 Tax=Amycolatopsis acidiphila TaxID=715473 RepID=A0A557ZV47_9PSEU|nr:alpha/beta hydrolase [Amycolatopsis acidiphila]TVT15875.1 alpha/beta hydrolase [Amycolatopsis acidiphila]UIJ58106.1 alpha/beta hydrolase [Amycolatopsis acidiphila]
MTSAIPGTRAVLLPGTGSDEVFVRSVFAGPLAAIGLGTVTPRPPAGEKLAVGFLTTLDELAVAGPLLVGGISFGAHLAAEWAVRNPGRCTGLLLALPAWHGEPGEAPASLAAKASADLVEREGLETALRLSVAGVAPWLADELTRAWRRHGDGLAAGLRVAAGHPAPGLEELRELDIPTGIAGCTDDPVHPVAVARTWAAAMPRAEVAETTLTALGADRESLGRAAVSAWLSAAQARPSPTRDGRNGQAC